ncbi:VOC family protein [Streptomyces qinglanensis]|uniref:VOC family protein n=1 Tax=Streptomyces qinglanensis TaxID=943816 RepID=UPI0037B7062E
METGVVALVAGGAPWAESVPHLAPYPARQPPYVMLASADGGGPELLLQQVPEPKRGKNRMHLDLRAWYPKAAAIEARFQFSRCPQRGSAAAGCVGAAGLGQQGDA